MRKSSTIRVVKVRNDDGSEIVPVEISEQLASFYKKETGHQRVTLKGLSRFLNNLVQSHLFF